MKIKDLLYLIGLFGIILISSCKVNRDVVANSENMAGKQDVEEAQSEAPAIIFLNYSIKRNSSGRPEIRFINQVVAKGRLKASLPENHHANSAGDLKCVELDAASQAVKSIYIPNPLQRTVEYVNESGEFSKKDVELDSAEFSVRMQLDPKTESVAIEQVSSTNGGNTNFLIVTKIK